jgi:hypothetical protein
LLNFESTKETAAGQFGQTIVYQASTFVDLVSAGYNCFEDFNRSFVESKIIKPRMAVGESSGKFSLGRNRIRRLPGISGERVLEAS